MLKTLTQAGLLIFVIFFAQASASSQPESVPVQAQASTVQPTNTPFLPLPTSTPTGIPSVQSFARASVSEDDPDELSAHSDDHEHGVEQVLLPDLQTMPPSDLNINYYPWSGRKFIRFSVEIWNSGPGTLELIGNPSSSGEETLVNQQLFDESGEAVGETEIGEFVYHPYHFHIHLGEFALYDLWSVTDDFSLDYVVATGGKVSYCVRDMNKVDFEPEFGEYPDKPAYTRCNAETQGLSPGWIDRYVYYLPGQIIEITGLPNDIYAVVSTVNPNKSLQEKNLFNNAGVTYFSLQDFKVNILVGRITEGMIQR